jgi:hypothetical protein
VLRLIDLDIHLVSHLGTFEDSLSKWITRFVLFLGLVVSIISQKMEIPRYVLFRCSDRSTGTRFAELIDLKNGDYVK